MKHNPWKLVKSILNPFSGSDSQLNEILSELAHEVTLSERTIVLEKLFHWVRANQPEARVRYLLQVVERNEDYRKALAINLQALFEETDAVGLFAHLGLVREQSFISELMQRLARRILPTPPSDKDLSEFFSRAFPSESDAEWVAKIPKELFDKISSLICYGSHEDPFFKLKYAQTEALIVLATQVASLGLEQEVRERLNHRTITQSPFHKLEKAVLVVVDSLTSTEVDEDIAREQYENCLKAIHECQTALQSVIKHLENFGVSVNLVYSLDQIAEGLYRIEVLLRLFFTEEDERYTELTIQFIADLIEDVSHSRGVLGLFDSNIHLLSRKIVERTAETGTHYITHSRQEYNKLVLSSAGGGVMTVLTAYLKTVISGLKLPLFFDGLFSGFNYAGSFLLLQAGHMTLATKQPAMTASALATKLRVLHNERDVEEFVSEVANLTRSQIASILSNVAFVVPGCILFSLCYAKVFSHQVMTPEYAEYFLKSLHPFKSLTIPLAAFTGVILWSSSIFAGWLDNWFVYNRLPEAIAKHRGLNIVLGSAFSQKLSQKLTGAMAGIGGNISLGFSLSFTPIIGKFFGLPLDVRHVTLSSGATTFAIMALGMSEQHLQPLAWAVLGIVFIGFLNLFVSFGLALLVAARARRVNVGWLKVLFKATLRRFRESPGNFLFPPGKH
jgi:site-specific recombinase